MRERARNFTSILFSQAKHISYTDAVSRSDDKLQAKYYLWKSRQLMVEVIRFQFQREAVKDAVNGRLKPSNQKGDPANRAISEGQRMSMLRPPRNSLDGSEETDEEGRRFFQPVEVFVESIEIRGVSTRVWAEQQRQYVQLSFGELHKP